MHMKFTVQSREETNGLHFLKINNSFPLLALLFLSKTHLKSYKLQRNKPINRDYDVESIYIYIYIIVIYIYIYIPQLG